MVKSKTLMQIFFTTGETHSRVRGMVLIVGDQLTEPAGNQEVLTTRTLCTILEETMNMYLWNNQGKKEVHRVQIKRRMQTRCLGTEHTLIQDSTIILSFFTLVWVHSYTLTCRFHHHSYTNASNLFHQHSRSYHRLKFIF